MISADESVKDAKSRKASLQHIRGKNHDEGFVIRRGCCSMRGLGDIPIDAVSDPSKNTFVGAGFTHLAFFEPSAAFKQDGAYEHYGRGHSTLMKILESDKFL